MKITFELDGVEDIAKLQAWLEAIKPIKPITTPLEYKPCTSINTLELGVRSKNCLKAELIWSIENLVTWSEKDFRKTPNLGLKSIKEIKAALAIVGLKLAEPGHSTKETTPRDTAVDYYSAM